MKTLSVSEVQALDRWAIEKIGIPSLVLMENAGRGVAQEIYKRLKDQTKPCVVIVCGTGNNGGDGFVIARYLSYWGVKPYIYLIGSITALKKDALVNYRVAKNLGIRVKPVSILTPAFKKAIRSADIIVDAIFGVGLNRPIQGPYYGVIEAINAQDAYIVAVDIPSGLDGTTGEIHGICVKADLTVTFSCLKKGFLKKHGASVTGQQVVVDIGIPDKWPKTK